MNEKPGPDKNSTQTKVKRKRDRSRTSSQREVINLAFEALGLLEKFERGKLTLEQRAQYRSKKLQQLRQKNLEQVHSHILILLLPSCILVDLTVNRLKGVVTNWTISTHNITVTPFSAGSEVPPGMTATRCLPFLRDLPPDTSISGRHNHDNALASHTGGCLTENLTEIALQTTKSLN